MALTNAERIRRYKARKRGEDVPLLPSGVKPGYKQSPEHIAKRIRQGAEHYAWKGDDILPRSARARAAKLYRNLGPCTSCGAAESERHHVNRNPVDNRAENIAVLCHPCHMRLHWEQGDFTQ